MTRAAPPSLTRNASIEGDAARENEGTRARLSKSKIKAHRKAGRIRFSNT
jgi:hypothetical protein